MSDNIQLKQRVVCRPTFEHGAHIVNAGYRVGQNGPMAHSTVNMAKLLSEGNQERPSAAASETLSCRTTSLSNAGC